MPKWGKTWGLEWGCPEEPELEIPLDICDRLRWWQHDNAANIKELCRIIVVMYSRRMSELEEIRASSGLNSQTGDHLDDTAAMVGTAREGVNDNLLRRKIQGAAYSLISKGRAIDIITVVKLIAADANPRIQDLQPLCFRLFINTVSLLDRDIIVQLVRQSKLAGVCMTVVELADDDGVFEFSYVEDDLITFLPVDHHWSHTDGDIPADQTAGFAFAI